MHLYNVGAPFEGITIDVAGPFPRRDQGNRYLLIAMDYFTKWPEAYAIPGQEASTVADVLVTNFFCRFGIPRELHSDQGRNFESRLLQEILQRLGVSKARNTPLNPQSDGMLERYINTVEKHLRNVVASNQKDWDPYATIFPTGLSGIHARYHRLHPSKIVIRKRAPTAQRSTVRDTPLQGAANNRACGKLGGQSA
jgi:transposase InsO family protein